MRGTINYATAKNKERSRAYKEIINKLQKLEKKLCKQPEDCKIKKEIINLKYQYNLLNTQEIAWKIRLNKQKKNANKAGKWLAFRLRKKKDKSRIKSLKDEKGNLSTNDTEIGKIIEFFIINYMGISQMKMRHKKTTKITLKQLKFTDEQQKILNQPLTKLKIIKAIRDQKKQKSPEPDGIPSEYYQFCKDLIIELWFDLISHIFQGKQIHGNHLILYCYPKKGKI